MIYKTDGENVEITVSSKEQEDRFKRFFEIEMLQGKRTEWSNGCIHYKMHVAAAKLFHFKQMSMKEVFQEHEPVPN